MKKIIKYNKFRGVLASGITLIFFAASVIPFSLSAQSTGAKISDSELRAFARHVVETSPEIKSRMAADSADILDLKSENRLQNPEIGFEYQFGQGSLGDKRTLKLSQSFDWPGLYAARANAVKAFREARAENINSLRQSLYLRVKLLMCDLTFANRSKLLLEEVESHLSQLCASLDKAYDQRAITVLDHRKATLELASASVKVNEQRARTIEIISEIKSLSADSSLTDIPVTSDYINETMLSEEQYHEADLRLNPEYASARTATKEALANLKVAKKSLFPGFSIGVLRASELGEKFTGFEIGISLPLWSGKHKKAAAEAKVRSALISEKATLNAARIGSEARIAKIKALEEKIKPYGEFFSSSDYLDLLKKSFDGGQISVMSYINELNYFLETSLAYEELIYKRQIELTNLNRFFD